MLPDQLNAYLDVTRADSGNYDIYTTSRNAVDAAFVAPVPLPGPLNSNGPERNVVASADNLSLYYALQTTTFQIYVATRSSPTVSFA